MIDRDLLSLLVCPETKKNLELADEATIAKVNAAIAEKKAFTKGKEKVEQPIDGGLLRQGDKKYLYPIRNNIPVLIVEELIEIPG